MVLIFFFNSFLHYYLFSNLHSSQQFGAGYGSCPGVNLAKIEVSKILATIIRDYDIAQVDPQQEWKYEAYFSTLPREWPVYVTRI